MSNPPTGSAHVGAQLRRLREEARLSQEDLGERLGLGRHQVSRVENGTRATSHLVLARWLEACGYRLTAEHQTTGVLVDLGGYA
jgi:transcriptional regulator with XRE-family HTH domain